jgi:hypothetical protein
MDTHFVLWSTQATPDISATKYIQKLILDYGHKERNEKVSSVYKGYILATN